ncbi:hypothetical protein GCM10007094_33740 [Pseudovibrio japonicus]|uniref:Polysaccharide pyruvyl transferase domain-containing protein n=1 Tax=Pseudovibrio japonicus TaxID=366534 RepID=A0ABQ3EN43_9HYPH|nr:polysaccharide pyruvyl transferase family protein [Pseudovibrio japonicus]GHB41541.1 hypothetical protein GCM10007094_33740 [Pseudovibrio japonicus]
MTLVNNLFGTQMNFLRKFKKTEQVSIHRPKIGITGSFGRGNYGDELFVNNYMYWFGDWAELLLLSGLPKPTYFKPLAKNLVDSVDAVVLGGGDLLCPYKPKVDRDFINPLYLRRPLHVAGIGVELNRPDQIEEVVGKWKHFLNHRNVRSISTRDAGSKEWMEKNITPSVNISSHPDLVCALPLPKIRDKSKAPILGLITRHIKHRKEYIVMTEVAKVMAARGWRIRHIVGGVGTHGLKDYDNSRFVEVPGKETFRSEKLDDISIAIGECSLVLSMKLHTTIVATMYGVPTICMNPVFKARQFMRLVDNEQSVFAHDDRAIFDFIEAGVKPAPSDSVARVRNDAEAYMRTLGGSIWNEFRNSQSKELQKKIPVTPPIPK